MQKNTKSDKFCRDTSEMRKKPDEINAVPGVNTPNIDVPEFNPPVPNRAWTEMRNEMYDKDLTQSEREEIYKKNHDSE